MIRLGYACICLSLKKDGISTNRSMTKATFNKKGLPYVSELFLKNLLDLEKILQWNVKNNIYVYRLSSDLAPWMSEYKFENLPNWDNINKKLKCIGDYIRNNNIRVSFHPGPYTVLASLKDTVIQKSIYELHQTTLILDYMGLDSTHQYPINIHVNSITPSLQESASRFVNVYSNLDTKIKNRLTLENDDSPNQFSVLKLYELIHLKTNIPLVFDQHHFNYGPQDQSMENAFKLAHSTWNNIIPITHMSSPRSIEEGTNNRAHADYIYESIQNYNLPIDVEIEAKAKDLALIKYRNTFNKN